MAHTLTAQIAAMVTDDEMILDSDSDGHWAAMLNVDGTYLALWVDENGVLHAVSRASAKSAIKLARESWGR